MEYYLEQTQVKSKDSSSKVTDNDVAYLESQWGIDCTDVKKSRVKLLPENYEASHIIDRLRQGIPVPMSGPFPFMDAYFLAHRFQCSDPDDVVEKAAIVFCALSNDAVERSKQQPKKKPEFMQ